MKLRKGFKQMVDEAKARITTIKLEDAKARLGREGVVFVDLRDVRELEREGMIPGAFHCPRGMLEFWIDPDSPYYKDVFAGQGVRLLLQRRVAVGAGLRHGPADGTGIRLRDG